MPALVSIIIPAYNCEKYIEAAIMSAVNQTYSPIEIIVVNDDSADETGEIIKAIEGKKNIKAIHQKNAGASASRNAGFKISNGRYIKFFDGDDLLNPEMVEKQMALAEINPGSIISSKWGRFYGDDLSTFKLNPEDCWQDMSPIDWICSSWKEGKSMTQPGIFLIPREIIHKAGLWDEELSRVDDMEFYTKIILSSSRIIFSSDSILYYRSGHSGRLSSSIGQKAALSTYKAINYLIKNQRVANWGTDGGTVAGENSYASRLLITLWISTIRSGPAGRG